MVSAKSIDEQLRRIGFQARRWNHAETVELASIILPGEQIFECVNGWYEGGFALLCGTDTRILLVDKKPLKFLAVEDLRFDMINEIDYSHRMLDASINVSAGNKILKFRSYNQQRLRKLIGHVQHRMAEIKREQAEHSINQRDKLQQIDSQLQNFLMAQYQQQESLRRNLPDSNLQIANFSSRPTTVDTSPVQYNDSVSAEDVWANGWLARHRTEPELAEKQVAHISSGLSADELYQAGVSEVFGNGSDRQLSASTTSNDDLSTGQSGFHLDINPLKVAYSKLPQLLKSRKQSMVESAQTTY